MSYVPTILKNHPAVKFINHVIECKLLLGTKENLPPIDWVKTTGKASKDVRRNALEDLGKLEKQAREEYEKTKSNYTLGFDSEMVNLSEMLDCPDFSKALEIYYTSKKQAANAQQR